MTKALAIATNTLILLTCLATTALAQDIEGGVSRTPRTRPAPKPAPTIRTVTNRTVTKIVTPTAGSLVVVAEPQTTIVVEPSETGQSYNGVVPSDDRTFTFDSLKPGRYRITGELKGQTVKKEIVIVRNKISTVVLDMIPSVSSAKARENLPESNAEITLPQMGRYYALVIGNNGYKFLPPLKTAQADAKEVAEVLQTQYGFETKLLLNASRQEIMAALSEYRRKLDDNSNLLIYYAGHGYYDPETEKGYWLPIDATKDDLSNWIIADDVTSGIRAIPAKHVLIVSDSCYSGTITRGLELSTFAPAGRSRQLQKLSEGKSRTLLASGGNEPVADGGGGGHSVFANAFLRALTQTEQKAFTAQEIFINFISEAVAGRSNQTPEYNPIRSSGHVNGDFIFIRK